MPSRVTANSESRLTSLISMHCLESRPCDPLDNFSVFPVVTRFHAVTAASGRRRSVVGLRAVAA